MRKPDLLTRRCFLWIVLLALVVVGLVACTPPSAPPFEPRNIPLRWIELHAPRHPECQAAGGGTVHTFVPTIDPSGWNSTEWIYSVVARMNTVYSGTGIQFWLQSHEIYCTDTLAHFFTDSTGGGLPEQLSKPFLGSEVSGDIALLYPHARFSPEELSASLSRVRWIQRAVALYGDRHGMTIFFHSDFVSGIAPPTLPYSTTNQDTTDDYVLPQHGFTPSSSPGLAFLFLSATTWAPNWQFDPELTVAHEIGHSLGNPHTLDFDIFAIGRDIFPDNSTYGWADFWDLTYVDSASGPQGFASRAEAMGWLAANPNDTSRLRHIDDLWNIVLDKGSGRMTAQLNYAPAKSVSSETMIATTGQGTVRLLQGLSFNLPYRQYQWQRNIMSYRYPDQVYTPAYTGTKAGAFDPYDLLTARFSQSQIELMQKQLMGSTSFTDKNYGPVSPATAPFFASRFDLLGDGTLAPFTWYSNGEGVNSVNTTDGLPDMVAFRAVPMPASLLAGLQVDSILPNTVDTSPQRLLPGDFNGDGLTDLLWYSIEDASAALILWSTAQNGLQTWQSERFGGKLALPAGAGPVLVADFDANGADDLLVSRPGAEEQQIVAFGRSPGCRRFDDCYGGTVAVRLPNIQAPYAVGNFDGRGGEDFVWVSHQNETSTAHIVWAGDGGALTQGDGIAVGRDGYTPIAGNFNGARGDDILWLNAKEPEIIWWGSDGGDGSPGQRMLCGGGGPANCADVTFQFPAEFTLPRLKVGDFDGNGADDFLYLTSHEPAVYFSKGGGALNYQDNFLTARVALYNSGQYLAVVGEYDNATYHGQALGDDLMLFYGSP
jgi:hypothetical protein